MIRIDHDSIVNSIMTRIESILEMHTTHFLNWQFWNKWPAIAYQKMLLMMEVGWVDESCRMSALYDRVSLDTQVQQLPLQAHSALVTPQGHPWNKDTWLIRPDTWPSLVCLSSFGLCMMVTYTKVSPRYSPPSVVHTDQCMRLRVHNQALDL